MASRRLTSRLPASTLADRNLVLPWSREPVHADVATEADLHSVEALWASVRTGPTAHWNWRIIAAQSSETFVIRTAGGMIVGLFASEARRLVIIDGEPLYRVDWMEVAPELRGGRRWGPLALAVAAVRAHECAARGLALPALAHLEEWYRTAVGAARVSKHAWKLARDLVPMKVVGQPFSDLVEAIDGS